MNMLVKITLTPSSDEWFETEVIPTLIVNVDGNFDVMFLTTLIKTN